MLRQMNPIHIFTPFICEIRLINSRSLLVISHTNWSQICVLLWRPEIKVDRTDVCDVTKTVLWLSVGGGGRPRSPVPSKSMQGRVFFLLVDLQTGLRATPVQLVFSLIIQNKTRETGRQPMRQQQKHGACSIHVMRNTNTFSVFSVWLPLWKWRSRSEKGCQTSSLWHS